MANSIAIAKLEISLAVRMSGRNRRAKTVARKWKQKFEIGRRWQTRGKGLTPEEVSYR
jgi:hypothetical protein